MFLPTFSILLVVVGLFFLVWFLARSLGVHQIPALQIGTGSPEILKQRYARGEIDRDEFERMKQDLEAI